VDDMIGRPELLDWKGALDHWKAQGIDLGRLLHAPKVDASVARWNSERQSHGLDGVFDRGLIEAAAPALERGEKVRIEQPVRNVHRSVGTMLSGDLARRHGHDGLPAGTISIRLAGTAGQSFGAFLAHGISIELVGDANDYVGKGLSGGRSAVRQPPHETREPGANIIVGNTVLYGAIAGEAYFNGVAGERFAVRNSGAVAVAEGAGDHCCEYMTGGVVMVLGPVGRNFAAGMSGGIAYVHDPDGRLEAQCNRTGIALEPVQPAGSSYGEAPRPHGTDVHDSGMGHPLGWDAERIRILLERHRRATGSARASELLADFPNALKAFVKVVPIEYRRALNDLDDSAAAVAAE
jgi:glutamate synthase (NADPH) large chain